LQETTFLKEIIKRGISEISVVHDGKHLFIVLLVSETARKLLEKEKVNENNR